MTEPGPPLQGEDDVRRRSRLFTVRVWNEVVDGAPALRGEVRDVAGGANRGFLTWESLIAFLTAQLGDAPPTKEMP